MCWPTMPSVTVAPRSARRQHRTVWASLGVSTEYDAGLVVTRTEDERVPDDVKIPRIADLLWPALKAVSEAGGSAKRDEIVDLVRGIAKMSDEQLAVLNQDGRPKVVARTIWAIRALRRIGALDSSQRGVYQPVEEVCSLNPAVQAALR